MHSQSRCFCPSNQIWTSPFSVHSSHHHTFNRYHFRQVHSSIEFFKCCGLSKPGSGSQLQARQRSAVERGRCSPFCCAKGSLITGLFQRRMRSQNITNHKNHAKKDRIICLDLEVWEYKGPIFGEELPPATLESKSPI